MHYFSETFYALAWNKVTIDGKKRCILAVGGALNTIYFLHPYEQRKLAQFTIGNRKSTAIFSLLFHPEQKNILFCRCLKFTFSFRKTTILYSLFTCPVYNAE